MCLKVATVCKISDRTSLKDFLPALKYLAKEAQQSGYQEAFEVLNRAVEEIKFLKEAKEN